MSDVVAGQVLVGKYRVERVLGQGGMGVVIEATHLQLGQRVALKFLLPEALHNSEVRGRFLREAQAAARLKSAHVARVIDVGALETGSPFIVMEYLEGEDLASVLRRHGPLPVHVAAAWLLEACEAIAEAHSLGIVHRDLKPSNLFLARGAGREIVKVFDFGISKVPMGAGLDMSLTRTQAVLGSPGYASPEQLRATKSVDHRTDIWALGVTLYQLVSGNIPWSADTLPELAIKIAVDPAPPLPPNAGVPAAFERVIQRCLEKDPAMRFPNVAALAEALGPFAPDGRAAVDRVQRASGAPERLQASTTLQSSAGEVAGSGRRARMWGVVGALFVAAAIAAVVVVVALGSDKTTAATSHGAVPDAATGETAVVVTATPDAAPLVAVTPDAAVEAAIAATPDAAVAHVPEPVEDRYTTLLREARARGRDNCAQAARLYEDALDVRPRDRDALVGLGGCLLELKDYDRAIGNFRAALRAAPRDADALFGAARAYERKGRVEEAIDHYERFLRAAPGDDRARAAKKSLDSLRERLDLEQLFGDGAKPRSK